MKPEIQKGMVEKVVQRVLQSYKNKGPRLEAVILDTLYEEHQRLEKESNQVDEIFYRHIQSQLLKKNPDYPKIFLTCVRHFTEEIHGHFNPLAYQAATKVIPIGLNLLLHALSPLSLLKNFSFELSRLDEQVKIYGETEHLQALAKRGTIILTPTHCSNLDSPLIGYVIYRLGLPPFLYGAGLNLFHNKLLGFFMDHLGAYKVDRKKKAPLYKEVLKTYAQISLEQGQHNLFFPGGTRSRSGAVERKLKLGLVGMGLKAYLHNLKERKPHPDIFVVPCTLNYQLVLEAETLIEDYLSAEGKERYIIEDDEFSQIHRILDFLRGLYSLDSQIHVVISKPLDPFGNPVDFTGKSLDPRGRPIDRKKYLLKEGEFADDDQRDHELTLELEKSILDQYQKDTVIGSVAFICRVVMEWLEESNPTLDFYRLLRTGGEHPSIPLKELYQRMQRLLKILHSQQKAGKLRLDATLMKYDPVHLLSDAIVHLQSYHLHPVLKRKGDQLFHHHRELIFYYQNRLPSLEESSQSFSLFGKGADRGQSEGKSNVEKIQ